VEAQPFAQPFTYWVGMDTDPRTSPEALADFNRFYSATHVGEVVAAHPGFLSASRYELITPDARGGEHYGPRWLAVYEMADEAAAQRYLADNARPWLHRRKYSPWPAARKKAKTVWRMLWRQIATSGAPRAQPESIFLVGMSVPADTPEAELASFNSFYTDVHLPEVMDRGGYARGTRYQLFEAFAHPAPGCPGFCAVYESSTADPGIDQEAFAKSPTFTPGPPTWARRNTLWRLVYRRMPAPE
jgi:hypothetical protein